MPKVTACLIAKNERNNIRLCIKELVGRVQEIVFVDTGSDDGTYESALILRDLRPAHIFEDGNPIPPLKVDRIEWQGFDHARNKSIGMASHDWVFIIDLDERLMPGHNLAKVASACEEGGLTFALGDIHNILNEGRQSIVRQCRLFNRRYGSYIEDPVRKIHNQLQITGSGPPQAYYGIRHFGYLERNQAAKYKERTEMIESWMAKEPDNYQAIFYYARQIIKKDPIQAERLLRRVLDASAFPDRLRPTVYANLYEARVAGGKASREGLIDLFLEGIREFPDHPDAYWLVAWAYSTEKDPGLLNQAAFYGAKFLEKVDLFKIKARPGEESRFLGMKSQARDLILGVALRVGLRKLAHEMVDQIIDSKNICPPAGDDDRMQVTGVKESENGLQEIQIGEKEEGD